MFMRLGNGFLIAITSKDVAKKASHYQFCLCAFCFSFSTPFRLNFYSYLFSCTIHCVTVAIFHYYSICNLKRAKIKRSFKLENIK